MRKNAIDDYTSLAVGVQRSWRVLREKERTWELGN